MLLGYTFVRYILEKVDGRKSLRVSVCVWACLSVCLSPHVWICTNVISIKHLAEIRASYTNVIVKIPLIPIYQVKEPDSFHSAVPSYDRANGRWLYKFGFICSFFALLDCRTSFPCGCVSSPLPSQVGFHCRLIIFNPVPTRGNFLVGRLGLGFSSAQNDVRVTQSSWVLVQMNSVSKTEEAEIPSASQASSQPRELLSQLDFCSWPRLLMTQKSPAAV